MSLTLIQSQHCKATRISLFAQCHVLFWLFASITTFIESKFSVRNHMSVAEWADTYAIHQWQILWSRSRTLTWVGFEPTTTEFLSNTLNHWTLRPWVQLAFRANFVQLLQFHLLFSVIFHFGSLPSSVTELSKFSVGNRMGVAESADTYDVHHWQILWK